MASISSSSSSSTAASASACASTTTVPTKTALLLVAGGAVGGAMLCAAALKLLQAGRDGTASSATANTPAAAGRPRGSEVVDREEDYARAHQVVWRNILGALGASQLYIGDRLQLYTTLRKLCAEPGASFSTVDLARETGLHRRWLREWLAQQAGMGVLDVMPAPDGSTGDGSFEDEYHTVRFRLPKAMGDVLANPESDEYDICMVQTVPALVQRARTMLPEAFRTGIGRPYDDADVTEAIDRQNRKAFRTVLLPRVLPMAGLTDQLTTGCAVAELGCGGGNMLVALSEAFPASSFHGFEVSAPALAHAGARIQARGLGNRVTLHDATQEGQALGDSGPQYDLIVVHDVLHDAPFPDRLVAMIRRALKPGGKFLLSDIACKNSLRENMADPECKGYFGFSVCLCMSCSMSEAGGAGLGTCGLSVPVARKLVVEDGGFESLDVLLEVEGNRWFLAR